MDYPAILTRDTNNTLLVRFPDFPEAHTFGEDVEEALGRAREALATVIDAYIKERRPIPAPSTPQRAYLVPLPALTDAKVRLYEIMRTGNVGKAELARRLQCHLPQIDRLVDVHHGSRLDQLEAAFSVLGKRVVVSLEDIEAPASGKKAASRSRSMIRRRSSRSHAGTR